MLWHSTTRESYSAEFIAVVFDLSRPTILEICADTLRLGDKFEFDTLRGSWAADRLRKSLPVTDQDWIQALIRASEHVEHVLTKSSKTLQVLLEQAHSASQRIAA